MNLLGRCPVPHRTTTPVGSLCWRVCGNYIAVVLCPWSQVRSILSRLARGVHLWKELSLWDDDLRPHQREVAGVERGNYLLIAGPGTGKTFVLVRRVQYLIEELGLQPRRIVALTFTRAAAGEMRQRLDQRLGGLRPRVSTLHSYALRELLTHRTGVIHRPVRIVDDWEERHVVEKELARLLGSTVRAVRDTLRELADDWDSLAADGDGWEEGFADPQFLSVWRRHRAIYRYTLRSELVYQLLQLYRTSPALTPAYPVDVFLVDEYQDLNLCDMTTIQLLVSRSKADIYAAGDDDQSIYSFRHAHPKGIRDFKRDYSDSKLLKLLECHRCGPAVVDVSNWLINQELGRLAKELISITEWDATVQLIVSRTEVEETRAIARLVKRAVLSGVEPSQILVLLRSDKNGQVSGPIVRELKQVDIEAYLPRADLGLTDDHQILLEYLNLTKAVQADDIDDLAVRSLLKLENNGIGDTRIGAVVDTAWAREQTFAEALSFLEKNPSEYSSTGLSTVLDAADTIYQRVAGLRQLPKELIGDWIARVVETLDLDDDVYHTASEVLRFIEESIGDRIDGADASELNFVQEFTATLAEIKDSRPPSVKGKVTLTTMHGSKGLSADMVFVLHAEDEVIPDGLKGIQYDEAPRLLYVSLSRARRILNIHVCSWRNRREYINNVQVSKQRTLTKFLFDYGLVAKSATDT